MSPNESQKTFSVAVLLLIPVAVAVNVAGAALTSALRLPVFLDMIGVILVGALAGPLPAAVTGVLSNLFNGIFDPTWLPFAFVSFWIGIAAGLMSKYGMMNTLRRMVLSGVVIGLVTTAASTPITVFVFGGISSAGMSMIVAGLLASGVELIRSVFSVTIVIELVGKILSVLAAWVIIRAMPDRSLLKFRFGASFISGRH